MPSAADDSVTVSVSVWPSLGSEMVTLSNGCTVVTSVTVCPPKVLMIRMGVVIVSHPSDPPRRRRGSQGGLGCQRVAAARVILFGIFAMAI